MISPIAYNDYRIYLHDWFWASKASNPKLSFRAIAKRLGLTSPNHFHLVISQKRHLSKEVFDKFLKFLKLEKRQLHFLKLLFLAEIEKDLEKRERLFENLETYRTQLKQEHDAPTDTKGIIGNSLAWYIKMGALWFEGLTKPEISLEISLRSQFSVTKYDIERALEILERSEHLRFEEDKAVFDFASIKTKWDMDNEAIKSHHQSTLNLAIRTIDWPIETRFLSNLTMTCDAELYQKAVQELRNLWMRLLSESEQKFTTKNECKSIVTFQIAAFPFFKFPDQP